MLRGEIGGMNMDEVDEGRTVPAWFWVVAVLALLFELLGCVMYWTQVSADPATLPVDQRALQDAMPMWMTAAYAIAVWVGLAGAILLVLRRRHAEPVLLVSLIAVVIQFGGILLVPELRDMVTPDAYAGPIGIAVIAYGIWHFARLSRKRGWLR
jgi:hypothetical protein